MLSIMALVEFVIEMDCVLPEDINGNVEVFENVPDKDFSKIMVPTTDTVKFNYRWLCS